MIDQAHITVKAGNGGSGGVSFIKTKRRIGPPDGGDGGKGGDVYFVAAPNQATLVDFRYKKIYEADSGKNGGANQKSGEAGDDLIIPVPSGTIIKNAASGEAIIDMASTQEPVLIAKGGLGGCGNMHMRKYASHASRQVPWEMWQNSQEGREGETYDIILELKLIADIGLIGLPNAGKSALLSVITAAKPKIGDYPFTTLEPNLGVLTANDASYIVADIPGLIEGASQGKGLGKEFLRHIERTKVLVHLTQSTHDYDVIRNELGHHSKALLEKPEIVAITKADTLSDDQISEIELDFHKRGVSSVVISAVTHHGLEALKTHISEIIH